MRVSMSATGSVSIVFLLPRALRHAWDRALVRELAQADPAEPELLEDRAGSAAAVAARILPHRKPRCARGLGDQRLLCHYVSSSLVWPAKGNPRPRRSASPCSSSFAVVVTATSRPRIAEMSS